MSKLQNRAEARGTQYTQISTSAPRPPMMTDDEIAEYLVDNGYSRALAQSGGKGLVARWRRFVADVEHGFPGRLEDYRQELDLRSLLSLAGLDDEVHDEDQRFAALLTHRDQRVWESGLGGDPFWDYGYPENAGGALWRDLQAAGLTAAE